jgi:RNA polymerase sigma factor (sigma-70 family)
MAREEDGFDDLMARLRSGDDAAETLVFRRYVRRLIVLAARQFDAWMRDRADVENVVLSAYKSFFLRNGRGEFDLADWDELSSLLAVMTLRKCTKRRKHMCAGRRDARRQVDLPAGDEDTLQLLDRAPTPGDAAILTETVARLFQAMTPDDRPIVEQILMGFTAGEVASQLDCSQRTVRRVRQRAKQRLRRLMEVEGTDGKWVE